MNIKHKQKRQCHETIRYDIFKFQVCTYGDALPSPGCAELNGKQNGLDMESNK